MQSRRRGGNRVEGDAIASKGMQYSRRVVLIQISNQLFKFLSAYISSISVIRVPILLPVSKDTTYMALARDEGIKNKSALDN